MQIAMKARKQEKFTHSSRVAALFQPIRFSANSHPMVHDHDSN